ncbi:MAG: heme exporter protein CcmD [Oceanicoccus sp.]
MQFDNFSDFMTMGGHGVYVWTVYGVALLVIAALVITPLRRDRRFFIEQSMLLRRDQASDRKTTNRVSK